ncbi:MAG TPA: thioesterase family protein [Thermoanaerobaculaceae bacterium]|nr:thioesterase family protein [Thermoanaerobaculaceae bacterium]HPS76708.1 thioesterase family protein [Thermoanaerobaculaceae bacterium]
MNSGFFPVRLRVRYAETDQMGVVHHAVYPVWFEVGRTALSRAAGMPYRQWEERGVYLMVAELVCRFRRAAHYDEEVTVWARVKELASRKMVFEYRITGPDDGLLAEGETLHVAVDRASGRPTVIPPELRAPFLRAITNPPVGA